MWTPSTSIEIFFYFLRFLLYLFWKTPHENCDIVVLEPNSADASKRRRRISLIDEGRQSVSIKVYLKLQKGSKNVQTEGWMVRIKVSQCQTITGDASLMNYRYDDTDRWRLRYKSCRDSALNRWRHKAVKEQKLSRGLSRVQVTTRVKVMGDGCIIDSIYHCLSN